mmetsp:Transcript_72656/g.168330  ORF Transcript_72656/g.168330 Transcript_72656/m.168330 type:complete len:230 (-) Transcript_72656:1702-2391(-)
MHSLRMRTAKPSGRSTETRPASNCSPWKDQGAAAAASAGLSPFSAAVAAAKRRQRARSWVIAESTTSCMQKSAPTKLNTDVRMLEVIILSWIRRHVRSLWPSQAVFNGSMASCMKKLERNSLMLDSCSLHTFSSPSTYSCEQPAKTKALMPATAHMAMETRKMTSTTTCNSKITDQKQSWVSWYCFMHNEQLSKHSAKRSRKVLGGSADLSSSGVTGRGPPKKPPAQNP